MVVLTPTDVRADETYYASSYSLSYTTRTSTEVHRYFRYPEYQQLIGQMVTLVKPPARLLDLGCDHGFFLDDARRFGYDVVGVEPSERCRAYAASIGLPVVPSFDDLDGSFDVVTMWHVLEHLSEPAAMLQKLHERMKPGGTLMIRVPDANSFWARLLADQWIWFQPQHHSYHYTKDSLEYLLTTSQFQIISLVHRKPNNILTRRAYALSYSVMHNAHALAKPSVRQVLARMYQDITGAELFAICRR